MPLPTIARGLGKQRSLLSAQGVPVGVVVGEAVVVAVSVAVGKGERGFPAEHLEQIRRNVAHNQCDHVGGGGHNAMAGLDVHVPFVWCSSERWWNKVVNPAWGARRMTPHWDKCLKEMCQGRSQ